jgi:hypothetical protein
MNQVAGMYRLGGMTLVSEIALPELPLIQHPDPVPHRVKLRLGRVAAHLADAVELDPYCFATPSQYLLCVEGIGRYLVTRGEEIVVDPEAGALPLDVRACLLSTIFVVLCQQRGMLPLHASAIAAKSGVVAFLARSGQGKSTLAAQFAQRGFRVIADDVCLIDTTQPGTAMVVPTAAWLKLWRNSLDHLGRQADGLERVFSEEDKYRLPLATSSEPEPIRKLVFLEASEVPTTQPEVELVSRLEALPLLMNLTHHAYLLEATGQRQENFLRCGRVLSQAKAYRLFRPWGLTHLDSTLDELERHVLQE